MAKFVDIQVKLGIYTDLAIECTFHEGNPEEETIWVPFSIMEDPDVTLKFIETGKDSNSEVTISVARWFLKKNNIPYEG